MTFQVSSERRAGKDGEVTVWRLADTQSSALAEICPDLGFNCFRWRAAATGEQELLYADPQFFSDGRPTRSGIPILFPFPNRIRGGAFTWEGKAYQLPRNDSTGQNAIHGFACRRAWRVLGHGADSRSAWVAAEFHAAADAPEAAPFWPADHRIRLTCRLHAGSLRLEAVVENPDRVFLPFGLGYHPYFRLPGEPPDGWVQAPARSYWELQDCLPTGARRPVDAARDLSLPRRFGELTLDDVLTDLAETMTYRSDGLCLRGRVERTTLYASPSFRELVVFTPPHRQAFCLEPYTCTTDAINLQQRGVEAGLLLLPPGAQWTAVVEMVV